MKIYPAIDLLQGRVVRLTQGRFDSSTVYADDPCAVARDFLARGAQYLHVVDLDGSRAGARRHTPQIEALLQVELEIQVGGGIRSLDDAREYLDAGAAAVVLGSVAVRDPELCERMFEVLGPDRVQLALDCRLDAGGTPRAVTQAWTALERVSVFDLVERYRGAGMQSFLCTDVERDGTLEGPNLELYERLVERFPDTSVIASGGVGGLADLEALEARGVAGAILGRALYAGALRLEQALELEQRPC